jgi:hypothetical protein
MRRAMKESLLQLTQREMLHASLSEAIALNANLRNAECGSEIISAQHLMKHIPRKSYR